MFRAENQHNNFFHQLEFLGDLRIWALREKWLDEKLCLSILNIFECKEKQKKSYKLDAKAKKNIFVSMVLFFCYKFWMKRIKNNQAL